MPIKCVFKTPEITNGVELNSTVAIPEPLSGSIAFARIVYFHGSTYLDVKFIPLN
ncbi:hypothetical protein [Lederbergia lenta]|uniref:hypothetical protein n=1 Tax=Lederbergia lenta TaxID=1467 RepID=UPI0012F7485D|nr:hypothetical protein [Lederbergia lenta]MEC2323092.1 hypothetical protein [Lederbergia lenta]